MSKRRNTTIIVFIAVLLFITYLSIGYFKNFSSSVSGQILQALSLFTSATLLAFKFLERQIPQIRDISEQITRPANRFMARIGLGISPAKSRGRITEINSQQLKKIKRKLVKNVETVCRQITKNIEDSSVIISDNYKIAQQAVVYPDFKSFGLKRNSNSKKSAETDEFECSIITGSPGGGKTYHLANNILEKIQALEDNRNTDHTLKIPVYVSLSSWNYHNTFTEWLLEAISNLYTALDRRNIQLLLDRNDVFVFADGLDEVVVENRQDCFLAIIEYSKDNDIVLCSRRDELEVLLQEVNVDNINNIAVHELCPLTTREIHSTIEASSVNATEIKRFLKSRVRLNDFIQSPLRLNLFLKVYKHSSQKLKQIISDQTISDNQIELLLWEEYDQQIYIEKHRAKKTPYTQKVFRSYIAWLAKRMTGNSFFIEEMQPSWLPTRASSILYYLVSRLLSCALLSLAIGLFIAEPLDFVGNCLCAGLVIVWLTRRINRTTKKVFAHWGMMVFLFSIVLIAVTSVYQGFAVPRIHSDMFGLFSLTEAFAGFLVGLFLGVIFGYRKSKQTVVADISPMQHQNEKNYFSPRNALQTGLIGGLGVGLFLGMAAYLIHSSFHDNFFDQWLVANVERFMGFLPVSFLGDQSAEQYTKIVIFGFFSGFFIGFLIFSLLGGRQKIRIENETHKRKNVSDTALNTGIKKSLQFAFVYGIIVGVIVAGAYGLFIFSLTHNKESIYRAISVGCGSGIIAFLWFGGFEFIQHWTLRMYLHLYGIAPFQYSKWLKTAQSMALIRQVGSSVQFYHPNLKGYYESLQMTVSEDRIQNLKKPRLLLLFNSILLLLLLAGIVYPFLQRFYFRSFWQKQNQIEIITKTGSIRIENDSTVLIQKTGILSVRAKGKIKLGTFIGSANANGTETALLGFPIGNVYDAQTQFKHGALLYRDSAMGGWMPINFKSVQVTSAEVNACIPVMGGTRLQFKVNDLEWHNNRRHIKVLVSLMDTCFVQKN